MTDYDSEAQEERTAAAGAAGRRLGPTSYILIGLLIGFLGALVLLWVLRGNPFSTVNEVVYTDVVVGSVTPDEDQLCWAQDPERRDSSQECAILALDPELEVPEAGDLVTIGLVRFRTPDGAEFSQVVHVAAVPADGVQGTVPPGADETP
jgi:hypothetical protein